MRGTQRGRFQAARGAAKRAEAAQRTQAAPLGSKQNETLRSDMEDIKRQLATLTATDQTVTQKRAETRSFSLAFRQVVTSFNTIKPVKATRGLSPISDSRF